MAMFLIVGCLTIEAQLPEETKPEEKNLVVNAEKSDEQQALEDVINPFANVENIPPNTVVTSQKPIICGRMDTMLNNAFEMHGEVPVIYGEAENISITGEKISSLMTVTHNAETGTYTLFEQLPTEKRLLCMLSGGKAEIKPKLSGLSS